VSLALAGVGVDAARELEAGTPEESASSSSRVDTAELPPYHPFLLSQDLAAGHFARVKSVLAGLLERLQVFSFLSFARCR
jgi:hypothetical protein